MNYRLLAVDMDDTLLGKDLRISAETVEAIREIREAGVKVVISSGRMYRAILPYFHQLELTDPVIVYNGAMTRRTGDDKILAHHPIPLELAKRVARRVEECGSQLNAYIDDWLYVRKRTPEVLRYMEKTRVDSTEVGPIADYLTVEPTKLLVIHYNLEEIAELKAKLQVEFGGELAITQSKPYFIELMAKGVSKGAALAELAAMMGVRAEEVIAIGDGLNDIEMIQWAGLGVAVANAVPELKAQANFVTDFTDEKGVVQVIEEFVLQRR